MNYHREYQKNAVATSNQGTLILMMYDGAIRFTHLALECLEKDDLAGRATYIQKSHDIVNELSLCLNLEKGGEVATRLEGLYRFILQQLTLANIKADPAPLKSVISILSPLREAWETIFKNDPQNSISTPDPTTLDTPPRRPASLSRLSADSGSYIKKDSSIEEPFRVFFSSH